jgi:ribosome-interacting GTPase 1
MADLVLCTIDLACEHPETQLRELQRILENQHVILKRHGESRPQGLMAEKTAIVVGTKADTPSADVKGETVFKEFNDRFPVVFVSKNNETNLQALKHAIFYALQIIRVYTKMPGKNQDLDKPYVMPYGCTVFDAAKVIHNELADRMKFARLWGSEKYDGQRVERDHVLEDKDIIEIHHK